MKWPRCKSCGADNVETVEWFGEGPYHRMHLCMICFPLQTNKVRSDEDDDRRSKTSIK